MSPGLRVLVVSPASLATSRAHSVSTVGLIASLSRLDLSVFVLSTDPSAKFFGTYEVASPGNTSRCTHSKIRVSRALMGSKSQSARRAAFALTLLHGAIKTRVSEKKVDLIWLRSAHCLFLARRKGAPIVLERHHSSSAFEVAIIRRLSRKRVCILAANSSRTKAGLIELGFSADKVLTVRAGVDPSFAVAPTLGSPQFSKTRPIHVVMVGNYESMGVRKGLDLLLECASNDNFPSDVQISVIGGTEDECKEIESKAVDLSIDQNRLRFFPRIRHADVPGALQSADFLLAIYSSASSESLTSEGPRKIQEYLQAGKPIIASKTSNVQEVLPEDAAIWFLPDNSNSLLKCLSSLRDFQVSATSIRDVWTFDYRTEVILNSVEKERMSERSGFIEPVDPT